MNQRSVMPAPSPARRMPATVLQRKCACGTHASSSECDQCARNRLQRRAVGGDGALDAPPLVRAVLGTAGEPLDRRTRADLEPRFGSDFSNVRVHADSTAARSASAVGALAYTVGQDIVFGAGQYRPASPAGRRLLAHELAHTLQQGARTSTLSPRLEIGPADSAAELEAERLADVVTDDQAPHTQPARPLALGHGEPGGPPLLQRQTPGGSRSLAGGPCDVSCKAYESMKRSVDGICRIAGEDSANCKEDRATLANTRTRIADAGCQCAATAPPQKTACTNTYARATTFQQLIDLVRAAEARLRAAGIGTPKDQIHALRGIYYGTAWSLDFSVEKSTTRNEGFQRFTRPSQAPGASVPTDVRSVLDCGLFEALRDSQDMVDPSGRHVDFGHLVIGLDARGDPAFTSNIKYPVATPLGGSLDIDLGGTGTELVTWLGDLGGGAASLALKRVAAPGTSASAVFTGSDYGGSINLEGDVAAAVVATSSTTALTAPSFAAGKALSDALQDYLSPAAPSAAWSARASTFLKMNGAAFDSSGALTNRAALIAAFAAKIQTFACNYLASRVGDKKVSLADAKTAAKTHIVPSSEEVATAFVDALLDSHKSGGRIEAKRFPSPSAGAKDACGMQLLAARFASP